MVGLGVGGLILFIFLYSFGVFLQNEKLSDFVVPALGQPTLATKSIRIGNTSLQVEIARTNETRVSGLSNRSELREGTGMLFEFEQDGRYSFWMKEMKFPIDMIWFDAGRRVVHVVNGATPESYPTLFTPTTLSRFVLEVPAGFATRHNIVVGDSFEFVEVTGSVEAD